MLGGDARLGLGLDRRGGITGLGLLIMGTLWGCGVRRFGEGEGGFRLYSALPAEVVYSLRDDTVVFTRPCNYRRCTLVQNSSSVWPNLTISRREAIFR